MFSGINFGPAGSSAHWASDTPRQPPPPKTVVAVGPLVRPEILLNFPFYSIFRAGPSGPSLSSGVFEANWPRTSSIVRASSIFRAVRSTSIGSADRGLSSGHAYLQAFALPSEQAVSSELCDRHPLECRPRPIFRPCLSSGFRSIFRASSIFRALRSTFIGHADRGLSSGHACLQAFALSSERALSSELCDRQPLGRRPRPIIRPCPT